MRQTTNQATRQETSDEAFAAMPRGSAQRVYEAIAKRPMCVDDLMIITRTRPTRAQLLERIADCIAYLETNSPPKRRAAINILRGGTQ
jgi:hypothetical protein